MSNVGSWHKNNLWDFESIKKRQEYLANTYALDVWKIVSRFNQQANPKSILVFLITQIGWQLKISFC